jgi:hypothetical protein
VLPHQEASYVRHIALDIGGSLIKLVYFSPDNPDEASVTHSSSGGAGAAGGHMKGHHHSKGGAFGSGCVWGGGWGCVVGPGGWVVWASGGGGQWAWAWVESEKLGNEGQYGGT